jgi:[acyl-carrier-protein] S-malonyltransferase
MGKELYDNYNCAREVFNNASDILKRDVCKLCFEGSEEELSKTENTQIAIVTTSIAIAGVLKEKGIIPELCAGLSLGEYSALIYSNAFSFEDGLRLIEKRGMIMQNAVPGGTGAMAAVVGMQKEKIEEYCKSVKVNGVLEIANYNCPGQIVITGEKELIDRAIIDLKDIGAMKTILLNVSGPFHSSMLYNAGFELEKEIRMVKINTPDIKVISNYDNEYYNCDIENTISKLRCQISSSVRWEDNINSFINNGVDLFIEVGPSRTLSGFMRKIDKSIASYNVEDLKSLEKLLDYIG